jgi:uncharacterized membrane protein YphA (DoxX/SURF4 family)
MKAYAHKAQPPALILSLGLAFVFLYAGIASLLNPLLWVGYLPQFMGNFIALDVALKFIAVYEIVLGLLLVSGKFRKVAAALSALTLAGIIVSSLNQFVITFRDVGLLLMAVALFFMSARRLD